MADISHGEVEDGILAALMPLHIDSGGSVRTIKTTSIPSQDGMIEMLATQILPAIVILAAESIAGPLGPRLHHTVKHTIKLYFASRSFRSAGDAASGVYEMLRDAKAALLGRSLFGVSGGEMLPGSEKLVVESAGFVVWEQEWQVTIFH